MEQSTHNQAQIIAAFYTVHQMEESKMYEQELQHCAVERVAEYHNTLRIVNHCVDQLTPSCVKVYRMSLFDGKCAGEIVKNLNVSKRPIESQLLSSRKKVRMMLLAI